jgi:hypothetical protein
VAVAILSELQFTDETLLICNQSVQKVLIRAKKFIKKFNMGIKNAKFHADFESVEKVLKKRTQKQFLAKT